MGRHGGNVYIAPALKAQRSRLEEEAPLLICLLSVRSARISQEIEKIRRSQLSAWLETVNLVVCVEASRDLQNGAAAGRLIWPSTQAAVLAGSEESSKLPCLLALCEVIAFSERGTEDSRALRS